jgi:hypothetical protein
VKKIAMLVAAAAIVMAVSACGSKAPVAAKTKSGTIVTTASVVDTIGPAGGATFAKYSKIKIGMTYAQVVKIMGNSGAERGNPNKTMDDKGSTPSSPRGVAVFAWMATQQDNTNSMHVTFRDNKVTAKDQAGLP